MKKYSLHEVARAIYGEVFRIYPLVGAGRLFRLLREATGVGEGELQRCAFRLSRMTLTKRQLGDAIEFLVAYRQRCR